MSDIFWSRELLEGIFLFLSALNTCPKDNDNFSFSTFLLSFAIISKSKPKTALRPSSITDVLFVEYKLEYFKSTFPVFNFLIWPGAYLSINVGEKIFEKLDEMSQTNN